jgi:hypothetical protein
MYVRLQDVLEIAAGIASSSGCLRNITSPTERKKIPPSLFNSVSVAAKKGAILAPVWTTIPVWSLSLLAGEFAQNGPEQSRARRYSARRSEPLTARTVLRPSAKRERLLPDRSKWSAEMARHWTATNNSGLNT